MTYQRRRIQPATVDLLTLLLLSGTTIGALRIGTDEADILIGTKRADQLNSKGGNDTLRGLAGNDTYAFGENWGIDTVEEQAHHRVTVRKRGKRTTKRVPGGVDTISFATITSRQVHIALIPEWFPQGAHFNSARDSVGNRVDLGTSPIEGGVGSSADRADTGYEIIEAGAGRHVLDTGGGTRNFLYDRSGWTGEGVPAMPPSNDAFRVISQPGGIDQIHDLGGDDDVLDLRPHKLSRVLFDAVDFDLDSLTHETLQIVTSPSSAVYVAGHFGPLSHWVEAGQDGRIETIIFADATITDTGSANRLSTAAGDGDSRYRARLRRAAPGLAAEARRSRPEALLYLDLDPKAADRPERNRP